MGGNLRLDGPRSVTKPRPQNERLMQAMLLLKTRHGKVARAAGRRCRLADVLCCLGVGTGVWGS
jgi:hypothetical protein